MVWVGVECRTMQYIVKVANKSYSVLLKCAILLASSGKII